jgi:hypothetical protein
MKRAAQSAVLILLLLVATDGRQSKAQALQPAEARPSSDLSAYDPMARGKGIGQSKGIVETALAGVNPQNKDYGTIVADWRRELFEATMNRIYLWTIFILCLGISASLVANAWFARERQRRLTITSDIVAQLYNAYIGSRAKALDVIKRYNCLVERYNYLSDEVNVLKAKIAIHPGEETRETTEFQDAKRGKPREQPAFTPEKTAAVEVKVGREGPTMSGDNSLTSLEELEAKLKRKEAQLQAKDNQITNLRGRLSRAHDSLEGSRQQNLWTK